MSLVTHIQLLPQKSQPRKSCPATTEPVCPVPHLPVATEGILPTQPPPPACPRGFGRHRTGAGSSGLTNPDGLSLGKAERSTDHTLRAVCMPGSKKTSHFQSTSSSQACASWERAARLRQSLLAHQPAPAGSGQSTAPCPAHIPPGLLGAPPPAGTGKGQEVPCKKLSVRGRKVTEQ